MSLLWLFRFADRTHPLLLPGVLLIVSLVGYGSLALVTGGGLILEVMGHRQFAGTLVMFSVMPCYLLAMMMLQRRRTQEALTALESQPFPAVLRVRNRLDRLHPMTLVGVLVGLVFGANQNLVFFTQSVQRPVLFAPMDAAFIVGGCLLWAMVALLLCWRVPVSLALSNLGAAMQVDIYRLDRLKPLARVATTDILVVAGAMVFMPLQSLDAEFRLVNYSAGVAVGVPAAIILFVLPLLGARRNIRRAKAGRLQLLRMRLDEADRGDVSMLETLTAHIERVRGMPDWPLDVQIVTRVIAYVIIPPLAWVGAALVENFVNGF